jgi:hypothetical protein
MAMLNALNFLLTLECGAKEVITLSESAETLSSSNLTHTTHGTAYAALIHCEGDARYYCDGSTPTFTAGVQISDNANNPLQIIGSTNLANFQAINDTTGTDATLTVLYFYEGDL